jgi:uncharacterized protein (DUF58 family)
VSPRRGADTTRPTPGRVRLTAARPGRRTVLVLACVSTLVLAALLAGMSTGTGWRLAAACGAGLLAAGLWDYASSVRAWRRASVRLVRSLPHAFAIGVTRQVVIALETPEPGRWRVELFDRADPSLVVEGLPIVFDVLPVARVETVYAVTPSRRGQVTFDAADLRVRSRWHLWELRVRLGEVQTRRVYPDFAQVGRYAFLAGDRRLQQIGIKTFPRRGEGTDFKQLSEYRVGDAIRHLDWKATLRIDKPIVREFQDSRDQCVMLLVDTGRRMRADDRSAATGAGTTHFDQVLNAVMLLSYVALHQGDAVGAMTFGTLPGQERAFPPRKGSRTLNLLMNELYDIQPNAVHSDYVLAARRLMERQRTRALVIVITNFRDEDSHELGQALRLLRSRHLVLLASLREQVVRELMAQQVTGGEAAIEIASAHLYEQSRRDAFRRLAARDALMVDAEPAQLGVELVNRYHAAKRAGTI